MTHQPITEHELACAGKAPTKTGSRQRSWIVERENTLYNYKGDDTRRTAAVALHFDGTVSLCFLLPSDVALELINELVDEAKTREWGPYAPRPLPEPPAGWQWYRDADPPALGDKTRRIVWVNEAGFLRQTAPAMDLSISVLECLVVEYRGRP